VDYDPILTEFEASWRTFEVIDITPSLARDAGEVADTFGLRAADAIQLATLRSIGATDLPMLAWDKRLRAAAQASGYPIYPPEV
jgi:predicted nucleic acid-binding protein